MNQEPTELIWTLWALGSSIEPREKHIAHTLALLKNLEENPLLQWFGTRFKLEFASSLIETNPFGQRAKNFFLNGLFVARTSCYPEELLFLAKKIEVICGRKTGFHWQDRELDLDLLLYGQKEIHLPHLQLPHAGLSRNYLRPLIPEIRGFLQLRQVNGNIFPFNIILNGFSSGEIQETMQKSI